MLAAIFDFGALEPAAERLYIASMTERRLEGESERARALLCELLLVAQVTHDVAYSDRPSCEPRRKKVMLLVALAYFRPFH